VSHATPLLAQLCHRLIWLDRGRIRMMGDPLSVMRGYDSGIHAELSNGKGRVEAVEVVPQGKLPFTPGAPPDPDTADRPDADKCVVFRAGPIFIDKVELVDAAGRPRSRFGVWDTLTVRVHYHCDGPIPVETLGMAIAINRKGDLLNVSQCYTQNVQPGEDPAAYDRPGTYRKRAGLKGVIEARIGPLQLQPSEYLLSVGLLPNIPCSWEFYEYHHLTYSFTVTSGADPIGAVVYAMVQWDHRPEHAAEVQPGDSTAGVRKSA
jgi:hypothetical protein